MKFKSEVMRTFFIKEVAKDNLVSDLKRDIPEFDPVLLYSNRMEQHTTKIFQQISNGLERVKFWSTGP